MMPAGEYDYDGVNLSLDPATIAKYAQRMGGIANQIDAVQQHDGITRDGLLIVYYNGSTYKSEWVKTTDDALERVRKLQTFENIQQINLFQLVERWEKSWRREVQEAREPGQEG